METENIAKDLASKMFHNLCYAVDKINSEARNAIAKVLETDEDFRERVVERFNQYVTLRKMILDVEDAKSPVEDRYEDGDWSTGIGNLMSSLEDIREFELDFDKFFDLKLNQELAQTSYEKIQIDHDEATKIYGKLYDGERYESVQKYLMEKYDLDG